MLVSSSFVHTLENGRLTTGFKIIALSYPSTCDSLSEKSARMNVDHKTTRFLDWRVGEGSQLLGLG